MRLKRRKKVRLKKRYCLEDELVQLSLSEKHALYSVKSAYNCTLDKVLKVYKIYRPKGIEFAIKATKLHIERGL